MFNVYIPGLIYAVHRLRKQFHYQHLNKACSCVTGYCLNRLTGRATDFMKRISTSGEARYCVYTLEGSYTDDFTGLFELVNLSGGSVTFSLEHGCK